MEKPILSMNQMMIKLHKTRCRNLRGERFESCSHDKVKKWFKKMKTKAQPIMIDFTLLPS